MIVAALASTGCSALFSVDAGYAHAFAQAPERSAEDDIRFDATPNTGYVSVLLGFGAVAYSSASGFFH